MGELGIAIGSDVWQSVALAIPLAFGWWAFGTLTARLTGVLERHASAGETLAVGLGFGLLVFTSWWAAIYSTGRSSFTPVAIGFAAAGALSIAGRRLNRTKTEARQLTSDPDFTTRLRPLVVAGLAAGFLVTIAILYSATMAPGQRNGVQPIEHPDEALYSVLGQDLATTGTETTHSPSGFTNVPGQATQSWYHWGELWLAAAVISVFGSQAMDARYLIALPISLLAAAALTGTLVRRLTATRSSQAYLLGFVSCLLLAPVPIVAGPVLSGWAAGMLFGITLYGLAAVAVVMALYGVAILGERPLSWPRALAIASTATFILPAHIVIAVLAIVGFAGAAGITVLGSLMRTGRLPAVTTAWRRICITTTILALATVAWGTFTDHGLIASPPLLTVTPFNSTWRDTLAVMLIGAGLFLTIPLAWIIDRGRSNVRLGLYSGTVVLLVFGASLWGWRLAEFNMFYVFFGGVAVFATPVAAVATWTVIERIRRSPRPSLGPVLMTAIVAQLVCGSDLALDRLAEYSPINHDPPVSVGLLSAIRSLPADAKLAYACQPQGEVTFGEPQLLSLDLHTGRAVIPMCFMSELVGGLRGGASSPLMASADWAYSPQRLLYPNAGAQPSPDAVARFLRSNGIDYIYADALHPNSLVPNAVPLISIGAATVARVPQP